MGKLSDMFSTSSILSGGITFANDNMLKATGQGKTSTLGAVNDALKHGPLESSINHGKAESFSTLLADRNERLGKDESGNARKIGDVMAVVGMAYGGAALGGAMGGGAAAGGEAAAGGTAVSGTGLSATGGGLGLSAPTSGYFGTAGSGLGLSAGGSTAGAAGGSVGGSVGASMGGAQGLAAPSSGTMGGSGSVLGSSATSSPGASWSDRVSSMSNSSGGSGQGNSRKKSEPYGTNKYSTYNSNSYPGADGNTIGVVGGIAYLFGPDGTVISSMPADHPELQSTIDSAVNT